MAAGPARRDAGGRANWSAAPTPSSTRPCSGRSGRGFIGSARTTCPTFLRANLMGSLQLFQAAFEAGVPRCVFISTCAVHDVILRDRPLDETHPLWPKSHYGRTRRRWRRSSTATAWARVGRSAPCGRPASTAWPTRPRRASGTTSSARCCAASRSPRRKGGKEVHAADVARAVDLLLTADAKAVAGPVVQLLRPLRRRTGTWPRSPRS